MNHRWRRIFLALNLGLIGCALVESKESSYLRSAQDQSREEDVRQHLGPPAAIQKNRTGETQWVYQVREQQPGNRMTAPGMWCDEYTLIFDEQDVLRRWTHKSYFHGGEFMPTYCVPGGYGAESTL